jgi:hypothetical protein
MGGSGKIFPAPFFVVTCHRRLKMNITKVPISGGDTLITILSFSGMMGVATESTGRVFEGTGGLSLNERQHKSNTD